MVYATPRYTSRVRTTNNGACNTRKTGKNLGLRIILYHNAPSRIIALTPNRCLLSFDNSSLVSIKNTLSNAVSQKSTVFRSVTDGTYLCMTPIFIDNSVAVSHCAVNFTFSSIRVSVESVD